MSFTYSLFHELSASQRGLRSCSVCISHLQDMWSFGVTGGQSVAAVDDTKSVGYPLKFIYCHAQCLPPQPTKSTVVEADHLLLLQTRYDHICLRLIGHQSDLAATDICALRHSTILICHESMGTSTSKNLHAREFVNELMGTYEFFF